MTIATRWATQGAVLALGLALIADPGSAADSKDIAVPDADYPKLVEHQLKVLEDSLKALQEAKDMTEKKKMTDKAHCTAVTLAAVAQDNLAGKDAAGRVALRDAALNVAALVKAGKVDDAAKSAADLKNVKPDAAAKAEKIKLFGPHIDLTELMTQFKLSKAGGQGIEAAFLKLGADKKKMVPTTAMTEALLNLTYLTAVVAELTAEHKPPKDVKDWVAYSQDMRKGAIELAETLRAKDGKAAFKALEKVNMSCSVCHDKFRK
jgi:hypothetical protein